MNYRKKIKILFAITCLLGMNGIFGATAMEKDIPQNVNQEVQEKKIEEIENIERIEEILNNEETIDKFNNRYKKILYENFQHYDKNAVTMKSLDHVRKTYWWNNRSTIFEFFNNTYNEEKNSGRNSFIYYQDAENFNSGFFEYYYKKNGYDLYIPSKQNFETEYFKCIKDFLDYYRPVLEYGYEKGEKQDKSPKFDDAFKDEAVFNKLAEKFEKYKNIIYTGALMYKEMSFYLKGIKFKNKETECNEDFKQLKKYLDKFKLFENCIKMHDIVELAKKGYLLKNHNVKIKDKIEDIKRSLASYGGTYQYDEDGNLIFCENINDADNVDYRSKRNSYYNDGLNEEMQKTIDEANYISNDDRYISKLLGSKYFNQEMETYKENLKKSFTILKKELDCVHTLETNCDELYKKISNLKDIKDQKTNLNEKEYSEYKEYVKKVNEIKDIASTIKKTYEEFKKIGEDELCGIFSINDLTGDVEKVLKYYEEFLKKFEYKDKSIKENNKIQENIQNLKTNLIPTIKNLGTRNFTGIDEKIHGLKVLINDLNRQKDILDINSEEMVELEKNLFKLMRLRNKLSLKENENELRNKLLEKIQKLTNEYLEKSNEAQKKYDEKSEELTKFKKEYEEIEKNYKDPNSLILKTLQTNLTNLQNEVDELSNDLNEKFSTIDYLVNLSSDFSNDKYIPKNDYRIALFKEYYKNNYKNVCAAEKRALDMLKYKFTKNYIKEEINNNNENIEDNEEYKNNINTDYNNTIEDIRKKETQRGWNLNIKRKNAELKQQQQLESYKRKKKYYEDEHTYYDRLDNLKSMKYENLDKQLNALNLKKYNELKKDLKDKDLESNFNQPLTLGVVDDLMEKERNSEKQYVENMDLEIKKKLEGIEENNQEEEHDDNNIFIWEPEN